MRRIVAALFAFALMTAPAMATPPVFNGDVINGTMPLYNVKFYGAKCDGTTNDATAIQNAINAAQTAGGGRVWLPAGTCAVSSTLMVTGKNVSLVGQGGENHHDTGLTTPATALKWTGTSGGGPILEFDAGTQNLKIGGVEHIAFLNNGAATGLEVLSGSLGTFNDLYFDAFSGNRMYFGVSASGEQQNSQYNFITNVMCDAPGYVDSATSVCLYATGGSSGDYSFNTVIGMHCITNNGDCVVLNYADSNVFMAVVNTHSGAGTGIAVDFKANTSSNQFYELSSSTGSLAETGSHDNSFVDYNVGSNSSPAPTIQSGATFWYNEDTGVRYSSSLVQGAFGENKGNATAARTNMPTSTSVFIKNTSADHIRLGDGTNTWGINIDGSGNLRFLRVAGTGSVSLGTTLTSTSQINTTSSIVAGSANAPGCVSGDGCFARSATTGAINIGGSSANCYVDYGVTTASALTFGCPATSTGALKGTSVTATSGSVSGSAHNACSASSGWPCEASGSCAVSAASSCSFTVTVPAGSVCTASVAGGLYTIGPWVSTSISSTTLTVNEQYSGAGTATSYANVTCL